MFPVFATNYISNSSFVNAEFTGDIFLHHAAGAKTPNFKHLFFREFCSAILFALSVKPGRVCVSSSLIGHVDHVIRSRTGKQMRRISAWGIVATVTYFHAFWNGAVVQLVRKSVRGVQSFPITNLAVTCWKRITIPAPTFIWAAHVYEIPKTINEGAATVVVVDVLNGFALDPALANPVVWSKPGLFATTAVAVTIWNFINVWGIIWHISISLLDVGHALGRSSGAGAFFCLNYTTFQGVG